MDAKQFFFERYEGYQEYPERLLNGLTEAQVRHSSHPSLSPIAWVLWHLARCEDVCINRVLSDNSEVLDEGGWNISLRVSERAIGTGMSKLDVAQLCEVINLTELGKYREAVTQRTRTVVRAFSSGDLADELSVERLRRVFVDEGAGGGAAEEIVGAYKGHSRGWLLGHLVLTHHYYHIGQAFGVRAMFGVGSPWS